MKVEMNNFNRSYASDVEPKINKVETSEPKYEKEVPKTAERSADTTEKENEKIRKFVEKMNKEFEMTDTSIEFKVHESRGIGLNKISIKVVEKESEKVIVEIPSEEAIECAEKMEEITGLLFDHSR